VTWAVVDDHEPTIGAAIEAAARTATGMVESTFDCYLGTAAFREALSSSDHPPVVRAPTTLLSALPDQLQADRLARLVIMFGPAGAAPIVRTGVDVFAVIDTEINYHRRRVRPRGRGRRPGRAPRPQLALDPRPAIIRSTAARSGHRAREPVRARPRLLGRSGNVSEVILATAPASSSTRSSVPYSHSATPLIG